MEEKERIASEIALAITKEFISNSTKGVQGYPTDFVNLSAAATEVYLKAKNAILGKFNVTKNVEEMNKAYL